ncbi:MAG: L-threonylcarbamoyladenylate synthase [Candidatus Margulisiibacteriota bacterium]|nr:L-threonylcarbamoyladenylate synthase [Candidatus Margulisiibacteriota bacterium]
MNLKKAAKTLKSGGIIAFPTETVFGIGACLDQPEAIKQIFKIKKRSCKKPLQILIGNMRQAKKLGKFSKRALELAKAWPGPLTLVIYKTGKVPKLVTGGSKKVGLRMPDHKTILNLIKKCGPIVATSANKAGEKPALTVKAVKKNLPEIDFVIPGRVKSGKASKVVDATGKPKTLRG